MKNMKTTNVFLIFLGLKLQELLSFLKKEGKVLAIFAIMILFSVAQGIAFESGISSFLILFVAYFLSFICFVIGGLVIILLAGIVIYSIGKSFYDNWQKAKLIAANRKMEQ